MKMRINKLVKEDAELFAAMEGKYVSENEKEFFEKQKYKQMNVFTFANDLVMWELDNEDLIYIVRCQYEEYIVGHGTEGCYDEEFHSMCLYDALNVNLKELGFIDRDLTLWQWLRERDYKGVQYDHNYDDL